MGDLRCYVAERIYRRFLVMYGAQHEFVLDNRDVDEYNRCRKFEEFTHLRQDIQKLIVYSTVETVVYIL